jgi:cell division protease FtsH
MTGVSDSMLDAVDQEVHRISDECLAEARRLLKANRDKLDAIVKALLTHETLDEGEVYAAAGIPRPPAGAGALAPAAALQPADPS